MKQLQAIPARSPTSLVLFSIGSTQLGSALAKSLFSTLDPAGVVLLRVGWAAFLLLLFYRTQLGKSLLPVHAPQLLGFGISLALMNFTFYLAIERIPLGIAVALEFIGPLGVAIVHSRKWLDALWIGSAALGIFLLTPLGGLVLDPVGIALALIAGSCWASYILLSARFGQLLPGSVGLAWAMAIAAVLLLPIGLWEAGSALLNSKLLLIGLGVALLSSVIPYSLELEALRFVPVQVFGVLQSLEPAAAALIGLLVLRERLPVRSLIAISLITIAAAGAARFAHRSGRDMKSGC